MMPANQNTSRDTSDCNAQLPTHKELVMRVIPMPADVNGNGDIFGGWVMAQVDLAGAVLPMRMAGKVATVAVNAFIFQHAVRVGDLLSFFAEVVRIGTTSIQIDVEVYAERLQPHRIVKVTEATLTYVAIGADGRPHPVPKR